MKIELKYEGRIICEVENTRDFLNLTYERISEISKIEGFDNMVNLKELSLTGNQISKIEGLDKLVNLEGLSLRGNQISQIAGLNKLVNLNELDLRGNQISKIEGLDNLVNLNKLFLRNNQISKIEGLDNLVNLTTLSLSDNQISKIEGLDNLVNLENLLLGNNPIKIKENLSRIISLTSLKNIKLGYEYPNDICSMVEDIIEQIKQIKAVSAFTDTYLPIYKIREAIMAAEKLQQYSEIFGGNDYIDEQVLIFKKRYNNIIKIG